MGFFLGVWELYNMCVALHPAFCICILEFENWICLLEPCLYRNVICEQAMW